MLYKHYTPIFLSNVRRNGYNGSEVLSKQRKNSLMEVSYVTIASPCLVFCIYLYDFSVKF